MIELVEKRQENSKTFKLDDGKRRLVVSIGAIHYKDNYASDEQWKDIDLTWVGNRITKAPYELTRDGNKLTIKNKRSGEVSTIELLEGDTPDVDIEIMPELSRVRFTRILKSSKAPTEAKFKVTGDFIVRASDEDGELPVESTLKDGILTETLKPDRPVKYPVRIDPTWQVSANTDDGCVYDPGNNYNNALVRQYIGKGPTNIFSNWQRFLNVTIPQGARIDSAFLTYKDVDGLAGTTVRTRIKGNDVNTATAPTTYADFWAKDRTTAYTDWSPGAWTSEVEYDSPSIVTIVKEIIDRGGWSSGNALQIFLDDNSSDTSAWRNPYSHDGDSAKAPKLVVTYTVEQAVGGGAISITGTLNRKTSKAIGAGSIAIAGTLARLIKLDVGSGSIAIAGTLGLKFLMTVGGGSIAIAGVLSRNIFVVVGAGAVGIAGSLSSVFKFLQAVGGGSIAISGSLSAIKRFTKAVGGGAVSMAGALGRKISLAVGSGSIAIAGTLSSILTHFVNVGSGSIAIAGTLTRNIFVSVGSGATAIAGALGRLIKTAVGGGAVTSAGSLELDYSLGIQVDEVAVSILKGSLVVDLRIEERSIAEFTIVDLPGTASYLKGQQVLIYDPDNTLLFGGVVDTPETIRSAPSGELLHPIRCADYHYFADKRLVAESYLATNAGDIVADIRTKYLVDEGVTIGNIEAGPEIIEAIFNYVRASDAYDALAEKAGKVWFIDENKALYFQDRDVTAAPWTATGDDMAKGSTKLSGANPKYRNRQYIRGGRGTTEEQTEEFLGDARRNTFTLSFKLAKIPTSIKEDGGAAKTIGIKGLDAPGDFEYYWSKGDATVYATVVPGNGVVIEIKYFGQFDILTLVEDVDEIAAQLAVEGVGTGYVDDIADEPTLIDKDASFDSGLAKLARFGVVGKHLSFRTTRSGLKPGQLLTVNYPALNLNADMLVEAVTIRAIRENLTYDVTVIQGPELGSWSNLFKALAAMKQEVIERLNVGAEQILIILVQHDETWSWNESITKTVITCDVVGTARVGTAIVC